MLVLINNVIFIGELSQNANGGVIMLHITINKHQ